MTSLLKKMRGDKKGWYKVSDLRPGVEIAVPSEKGQAIWDEIVSIKPVGREQVYDIEVEGTHNFVGNGIFAHNTYVLRANTMLAVEGVVVPVPALPLSGGLPPATTTSAIPPEVLTADGLGVDLFKLATYNLATTTALAARVDETDVRVTSLETRVEALESGAVSSAGATSSLSLSTTSLANALNSFGVLIQKGIAQFNTLVFRQLVASKDADGTSSAGNATIWATNTVAQVNNPLVLPSTKVFVTFNSSVTGGWWVSDKTAGSFRVVLSQPQALDVSFDYFLVQTEGQIATSTPNGIQGSTLNSNSQGQTFDTTAPVITLLGDNPLYLSVGGAFTDPGVTVTDDVDAAVPVVTFIDGVQQETGGLDASSPTTHIITYSATDNKGNLATATRAVIVGSTSLTTGGGAPAPDSFGGETATATVAVSPPSSADTVAPVVTLNGDAAMQITVGDSFTDPGATASDPSTELGAGDTDLTASIVVTGSVDTAIAGSYTITYTATDSAGNAGQVSRLVTVAAPAPAPAPAPEPEPSPAP